MKRLHVLFVDDEPELCRSAAEWLDLSGFEVTTAHAPAIARKVLTETDIDVVVSDIRMPGEDGIELLRHIIKAHSGIPVILLTGHGDVALAVQAMREGAFDFLEKPYDADHLVATLNKAGETQRLRAELAQMRQRLMDASGISVRLAGNSDAIREVRDEIVRLASQSVNVLITGDTGTGKDVAARLVHELGQRSAMPFVMIDCASIPDEQFEARMFGHSVTGTTGLLEAADGGSVYFDAVDTMTEKAQSKLLRFLEDQMVPGQAGRKPRKLKLRIISSMAAGEGVPSTVREDLYYRLATAQLHMPPLSERMADCPVLFDLFVRHVCAENGLEVPAISESMIADLMGRRWAGNVRELKSHATRFALGLDARVDQSRASEQPESLNAILAGIERDLIERALTAHGYNQSKAAVHLGIPRRTLGERISRLGIDVERLKL